MKNTYYLYSILKIFSVSTMIGFLTITIKYCANIFTSIAFQKKYFYSDFDSLVFTVALFFVIGVVLELRVIQQSNKKTIDFSSRLFIDDISAKLPNILKVIEKLHKNMNYSLSDNFEVTILEKKTSHILFEKKITIKFFKNNSKVTRLEVYAEPSFMSISPNAYPYEIIKMIQYELSK